jgi:hypothetical protein
MTMAGSPMERKAGTEEAVQDLAEPGSGFY